MAFDEAKFRSAAKAAGYSDDEINAELNTTTVAASAPPPTMDQTFSDSTAKAKADYDARVHKALTSEVKIGDNTYEIPSFFTSPAGIITAASAGIGLASTLMGAARVAPKAYNAIKDRWISKAPAIDRTVDIPLEGPTATLDAKTAPVVEAPIPKGWEDIIAKSEANAAAKAADAAAKANPLPSGAAAGVPGAINPMDQLTAQPAAYPLIQKPVVGSMPDGAPEAIVSPPPAAAAAPEAPVAPQQTLKQAVETGGDVGKALKTDVAGMVDQAAGVAPPLTKPQQGMKNWLLNQYGGKDLPMAHEAYDQVKQILGYTPAYQEGSRGGSLMPEEKGKILDWRKEALPGPKVNLTHDMKKVLKVGGPALAALIATTEFANAKTAQDKASAGTNLLGAILPLGMDINAAGAPGVQQSQISQAALLGSPYAQTEWAKTQRLRERAGAGRGIAPPSAYQR